MEEVKSKIKCRKFYKNGQLHADGVNPAIQHFSEKGVMTEEEYYKFGIKVDKAFCQQDFSKVDPKVVFQEKNAQKRMMWIELIGFEKIFDALKGKIIGMSKNGEYSLLEFEGIVETPMKVLKMQCPSTKKDYLIPVHPNCDTVEKALHWYYGEEDYNFIKET